MPEIYLPKKAEVTEWVTVPNISGTGNAIVASAFMELFFPPGSFHDVSVEIEYTHRRTSGTGTVATWAQLRGAQVTSFTDNVGVPSTNFYTSPSWNLSTNRTRKILIRPVSISQPAMGQSSDTSADKILVWIRSNASAGDTDWEVTGIRARLIYTLL